MCGNLQANHFAYIIFFNIKNHPSEVGTLIVSLFR